MIYKIKVLMPYWESESSKPTEYSPYRIIEVDSKTKLSDFAEIILYSFDFKDPKPYGFYYNNINNYIFAKEGYVMKFEEDDEWNTFDPDDIYGDVETGVVSDIITRRGKKWLLLFDYLKEWKFHITLIDKYKNENTKTLPNIIERYMKAPLQYERQR